VVSVSKIGLFFCLVFVTLEAFQAVYLGSVFQNADSFLVGACVFGISVLACTFITALFRAEELVASFRSWKILAALNVYAAITWCTYLLAIQLIEPAIVFTVFSGMVPLGTVIAAWCGLPEAGSTRQKSDIIGNALIFLALLFLGAVTVLGYSGFVRGSWLTGIAGVLLSAVSGLCTALVILLSARLNRKGVGPLAQFGLRFILYTFLALAAYALGLDDKGIRMQLSDLVVVIVVGLGVIAFPLYLVQKAIPLLQTSTIAAMTALGPVMVFSMQLLEGRVDYSAATLTGLIVYMAGALLAVYGSVLQSSHTRTECSRTVC